MLHLGTNARLAETWTEMATSCMNAAVAQSMSNMGVMVDVWSAAAGLPTGQQSYRRSPLSTAMPWYRMPEPRAFDALPWLSLFDRPTSFMPTSFMPTPFQGAHGTAAVVPSLLAMVALGAMAQHALSLIDLSRQWQSTPLRNQSYDHPVYRSDSGHATAAILKPATEAYAALPAAGFAFTLRMMRVMSER